MLKIIKLFKNKNELKVKEIITSCIIGDARRVQLDKDEEFTAVKWLNKHGLIKYTKIKECDFVIFPTLFSYYLTYVLGKDSEGIYNEAVKLYNIIGEEKYEGRKHNS